MNISPKTLAILKNCATINSNLLIKPGNRISTITQTGDLLLRADVEEEFPVKIAIYDLNQLLSTLTLIGDQDITFNEKSLLIKSGEHSIEYFYAGDGIVQWDEKWDKPVKEVVSHFEFTLSDKDLTLIQKSASIFSAPKMSISCNGEEAALFVGDPNIPSSNSYKKQLGPCQAKFNYKLSMETLKVISDNYTVYLPKGKKRIFFKGTNYTTQYWMGVDPSSEVE